MQSDVGRGSITQWLLVLGIDGLFPEGNKKPLIGRKLWSDIMGFVFLKNNNLSAAVWSTDRREGSVGKARLVERLGWLSR